MPRAMTFSRAGIIGTFAVIIVVLGCTRLGFWQLDRLEQKRARNAATHARAAEPPVQLTSAIRDTAGMIFRRATVTGAYDDERTIIIAGRSSRGVPGVYILTPVRLGGSAVLVNRGFVPSPDAEHVDLAPLREPDPRKADGLIVYLGHDDQSANSPTAAFQRVWYRPSIGQLRAQFPYPLADYVIQLLPAADAPRLPDRLPAPALDEGPHLGYAIQWFSFAAIFLIGWFVMVFRRKRVVARVALGLSLLFLLPPLAQAQLRPLDPVDARAFTSAPVRVHVGAARFTGQHASLAGTRGTLWEIADFRATIRTGRLVVDLGGTVQRLFKDEQSITTPTGEAEPAPADGKRHDAGDYRVGAIVRLTPDAYTTLATLRFGTRLPTTDNRVGLDRDAIDFFATLSAHRRYAWLSLAVEAGLGIHGTRKIDYEQADVLLYALTAEIDVRTVTPFITVLGQQDFQEFAIRGNEDLAELRAGLHAGSQHWLRIAWIHGLTDYSPSNGFQIAFGTSFGKR